MIPYAIREFIIKNRKVGSLLVFGWLDTPEEGEPETPREREMTLVWKADGTESVFLG